MRKIFEMIWGLRMWADRSGQDLVEYALLAGFVAVAAGATIPSVSSSMSTIYSMVASKLIQAGG